MCNARNFRGAEINVRAMMSSMKPSARMKSLYVTEIIVCSLVVLAISACDPIRNFSASGRVPMPIERSCVLETLRTDNAVRNAGIGDTGLVYGVLRVPEALKSPEKNPDVGFDERKNNKGEIEIAFSMTWVGSSGSAEYQAYIQKALDELRDRAIEKCSRK
jgi:hypothetical protein